MLILIALLVIVWFICVNAIMLDAKNQYEESKRKFELYAKSDNLKFYPVHSIKGNGTCNEKDF